MKPEFQSKAKSSLLFILLFVFFISNLLYPWLDVSSDPGNVFANKQAQMLQYTDDGAWMHVDTFAREPDQVLEEYAEALVRSNIKTIFILAKKIDGSVNYPSKNALKRSFTDDPMKRVVACLRSKQIEVYFYYPINTDPAWNAKHPEDIAWQYGNPQQKVAFQDPERKLVNLTSTPYREYIRLLIEDAFELYDINGIQLDYIRFRNAHWGFSPKELSTAKDRGVNISRIQDLTYATFVKPGDWNTILKKYDEKDSDVLQWVECRKDIVFNFAQGISQYVRKKNKKFSSTLIHSGASKSAYGAVHFSQSYPRLSSIADLVVPMAYHGSNTEVRKLVQEVIDGSKEQIAPNCRIMIGIQAYETSSRLLMQAVQTVHQNKLAFVLFRVGTFALVDLQWTFQENQDSSIHARIFNSIPQQSIQGFEIRGLGAMFQMEDNCWDKEQCSFEDGFKIWGSVFSNKIESFSVSLPLKTTPEHLSDFLQPMVVLADAKKDIPSFTTGQVNFQHFILRTALNEGQKKEGSFPLQFKLSEGISYIRAEDLKNFNIEVKEETAHMVWSFTHGERKIIFDYNDDKLKMQLASNTNYLEYPKNWPRITPGWIPVRLLFELLAYTLFYNPKQKEVHLVKLLDITNGPVVGELDSYSDINWLFGVGEVFVEPFHKYLEGDFYQKSDLLHSKGRSIRLGVQNEWTHSPHADTIFWMLRERGKPWYLADFIEWNR